MYVTPMHAPLQSGGCLRSISRHESLPNKFGWLVDTLWHAGVEKLQMPGDSAAGSSVGMSRCTSVRSIRHPHHSKMVI